MGDPIADELAIRNLVGRYCDAVARADHEQWADTFAEDGEWHVLGQVGAGRDAALAMLKRLTADIPFVVQHATDGVIEVEGDRARGRWQVTELARRNDGGALRNLGIYEDEYVRTAGGWRFARRVFHALYIGPPDLSGTLLPTPALPTLRASGS